MMSVSKVMVAAIIGKNCLTVLEIFVPLRKCFTDRFLIFMQPVWITITHSEDSIRFFKIVQNKLHFAAHGHTAAEVIYEWADAEKPFMGLTSFSGELPALKDIGTAKNYLEENELRVLNNLVSGYFDLAEINAIEHKPMYMSDYVQQLNSVLSSGNRKLLQNKGSVILRQ